MSPDRAPSSRYAVMVAAAQWTDISGSDASATSHTITGLTNGAAHTITLRAVKSDDPYFRLGAVTATPSNWPGPPAEGPARAQSSFS